MSLQEIMLGVWLTDKFRDVVEAEINKFPHSTNNMHNIVTWMFVLYVTLNIICNALSEQYKGVASLKI
jgi:exo-beta-1,3-glucanase (GH17 family)